MSQIEYGNTNKKFIISIDVGIKNLGICIFNVCREMRLVDGEEELFSNVKIEDWKTVSLIKENTKKCDKCMKNGSKCGNVGTYQGVCEGIEMNYCGRHKGTFDKGAIITTRKAVKANSVNMVDLGVAIKEELDKITNSLERIDVVLIENQISPIANRMKTIQGMIMQYYIMKDVRSVIMISSQNKLKNFENIKKNSYKNRKLLGIAITRELLNSELFKHGKWLFVGNKLDDLADAFLQGYYYLAKEQHISKQNVMLSTHV